MKTLVSLLLAVALVGSGVPGVASPTPTEQVKDTIDGILGMLRDSSLEKLERRKQIRALINTRFSFPIMSRSVLAKMWERGTKEEKERFIELFSGILESTYMERIEAYTDEKVDFVGEKVKNDKAVVETKIVTSSVEIPIDYKVVQRDGEWFVYDVVIEGVSLVRNYRSSYQEIARRDGYEGLLQQMDKKLQDMKAEKAQE